MYEYKCVIVKVVDGDTVDVDIDLGFGCWLVNQRVRIFGIDAPETRTKDLSEKEKGLVSKQFVEAVLPIHSNQVLISKSYDGDKGKYGRILGTFRMFDALNDRWSNLSDIMVEQGYAEKYLQ